MGKRPFLSVIMPVYNSELYLDDVISSLLNQTFRDFEVIIVDDASKDKSLEICRKYAEMDSRIKVIPVEKNCGAGNARNIGIQISEGKYITFIDSDDFIDDTLFFSAYEMTIKNNLDMVVWGMTEEYLDKKGNCYCQNILNLPEKVYENKDEIKDAVILLEEKTLFGYQCNRFYKADILKENSIQFEKVILYEDYFFNLEFITKVHSVGIISNSGYHYMKRVNESITNRFVPEYFELSKRRIESMYQLYQQWDADSKHVKNILGERYLRYILAGLTKSFDKRAKSSNGFRKKWLIEVRNDALYKQLVEECEVNQKILKVFHFLTTRNRWYLSIAFGEAVWIVKEKMPMVFNKIRRFK